jgi:hypothetical protein
MAMRIGADRDCFQWYVGIGKEPRRSGRDAAANEK